MSDEITGNWDDLVNRRDLRGRKVRVIILDEPADGAQASGVDTWLRNLRAWADSHKPFGRPVDDSRQSIYSGSLDDPR